MSDEIPFRIALSITIVLLSSITLTFRRRAKTPDEKICHDSEGWARYIALQSSALILFVSNLAYLLFPPAVTWASIPIPNVLRWFGFLSAILSSVPMIATLSVLGKNLTDTVVTKSDAFLVTSGPYRWVRHPYYSITAIIMLSVSVLTANWLIGLGCVAVLTLLATRTPLEEQKLVERFGVDYLNYKANTGMFVPYFLHFRSRQVIAVPSQPKAPKDDLTAESNDRAT